MPEDNRRNGKMKREKSPEMPEKIESSGGDGDGDLDGDTTMDPELDESLVQAADAPPAKRKGGRKPIYATSEERKQRNRQAQAAFRERRSEYIKELEKKLEMLNEQNREFQIKNRLSSEECLSLRYRNSLLERILQERGIDYKVELQKIEMTIPNRMPQIVNNQAPRPQYPNRALPGPNGAPMNNIQPGGMGFGASISSPRTFSAQGGSHANSPSTRTPMPIAANEPARSNLSGPAQTAMYPQSMPPPTYGGMPDQAVPQQSSYMSNTGQWAPYQSAAPQVDQEFTQEMYVGEHAQSSTPQGATTHNTQYDYRSRPLRPMAPMSNLANDNQSGTSQSGQRALAPAPPYGAMPENDPFGLNTGGISYPPPFSYPDASRRNQGEGDGH